MSPADVVIAQANSTALTSEQREVLARVLGWDDYVLVRGLPGAGKTSTICALAQVRCISACMAAASTLTMLMIEACTSSTCAWG